MTPPEHIARELRKVDRRGCLKFRPEPELWSGNMPVVPASFSIVTRIGTRCVFDGESFAIFDGPNCICLIRYADVRGVHWMSKDLEEKVHMKRTPDIDRLVVERAQETDFVIEGLDQAVFPLLKAFEWIAASNANPSA